VMLRNPPHSLGGVIPQRLGSHVETLRSALRRHAQHLYMIVVKIAYDS